MKAFRTLLAVAAALALGGLCGCESSSSGDGTDGSTNTNGTSSGTGTTPSATTFFSGNVTILMHATYDSGNVTAPGAGTISAHVKSGVGSDLKAWFVKTADASVHNTATGNDFSISVPTDSGEKWRLKIFNPSDVAIDTTVSVSYAP